jgi:hypothetical protein
LRRGCRCTTGLAGCWAPGVLAWRRQAALKLGSRLSGRRRTAGLARCRIPGVLVRRRQAALKLGSRLSGRRRAAGLARCRIPGVLVWRRHAVLKLRSRLSSCWCASGLAGRRAPGALVWRRHAAFHLGSRLLRRPRAAAVLVAATGAGNGLRRATTWLCHDPMGRHSRDHRHDADSRPQHANPFAKTQNTPPPARARIPQNYARVRSQDPLQTRRSEGGRGRSRWRTPLG